MHFKLPQTVGKEYQLTMELQYKVNPMRGSPFSPSSQKS